jgi:hypothetical protein
MMEYVIEKNVPPPEMRVSSGLTDVLRSMEVGDSILFQDLKQTGLSGFITNVCRKDPARRYTSRKIDGGTRVWRIA